MKRLAVICGVILVLTIFLSGCAVVIESQIVPAGVRAVFPPISCDAVVEWLDEGGDGVADAMKHKPDPECVRRFRQAVIDESAT